MLALAQEMEIVQQALLRYQKAGGKVIIVPVLWWNGDSGPAIFLPGGVLELE
jgi:hypothetical protein